LIRKKEIGLHSTKIGLIGVNHQIHTFFTGVEQGYEWGGEGKGRSSCSGRSQEEETECIGGESSKKEMEKMRMAGW